MDRWPREGSEDEGRSRQGQGAAGGRMWGEEGVRSQLKLCYFGWTSVLAMIRQELFDPEEAQVTTRSSGLR